MKDKKNVLKIISSPALAVDCCDVTSHCPEAYYHHKVCRFLDAGAGSSEVLAGLEAHYRNVQPEEPGDAS